MTRCGKTFLVVAALMCAGLLSGGSVARGDEDYKYERGGVLFYAGFDGTRDALAVGDGKARLIGGGGVLTPSGVDSVRDRALRSGDSIGYVEFSAEGNVLPDAGTVEFWVKPGDWGSDHNQRHVFVEIVGDDGGLIRFSQGADNVNVYLLKGPKAKEPNNWAEQHSGTVNVAYGSGFREGMWKQVFLIWKKGHGISYYRGYLYKIYLHRTADMKEDVPSLGKLTTIRIGDFGGGKNRNAFTYIDEVYIYNRALSWEECVWANKNATTRAPGMDIPVSFAQPTVEVVPDPRRNELEVRVDSGNLEAAVHGTVQLQPASGTTAAEIMPQGRRYGLARIAYTKLPPGQYRVVAQIEDDQGRELGRPETLLTAPEDPGKWLGNKIGISDVPPPPFTPIVADRQSIHVWGRTYELGALGLPEKVVTEGEAILSGPVQLCVMDENKAVVPWGGESSEIDKLTAAEVDISGRSKAEGVTLTWRCYAEYDGMLRYDFSMPAGSTAGGLQLRIPLQGRFATLYYTSRGCRGALPQEEGVIWHTGFDHYIWIGNEEAGICAFQEDDRGWIKGSAGDMRLERQGDTVTLVYDLAQSSFKLAKAWEFTFGLQATPVRSRPKDWRSLRDEGAPFGVNLHHPNPDKNTQYYCSVPSPRDPDQYKKYIASMQAKGLKVIPYSGLNIMATAVPEYVWFQREWALGPVMTESNTFWSYAFLRVVPSLVDFMVWKNVSLFEDLGYDGIYVDFGGARFPFCAPELGVGYERDGRKKEGLPIFHTREVYKRIYTAFKERNPETLLWVHTSNAVHVPVLAFCDIWLGGEGNWTGQLRDNYLDVLPLDVLRAEFMGRQYGAIPFCLAQWKFAELEDKDVAERFKDHPSMPDGAPKFVTIEKSHHLFGLGLLHDFYVAPYNGTHPEASKQFFGVQDEFGMTDVEFFGYWKNSDLIAGQTDAVKASAYRKPEGGALIVVYNVTREAKTADLTVAWERLKGKGALEVIDAYTEKPIEVSVKSVSIEVPPLNHRLLWIK